METSLWEVKITYSFSYGGLTHTRHFFVGAENVSEASSLAIEFLEKKDWFNKEIVSISNTGSTLFQK